MKRKELVIFGIFLFLILFACNKEIEHAPPDINSESGDYFDVISAQAYFETHATDLSPIRFSDTISTRSGGIELIPEWKRAIVSSNKNVDIVEVPIWSNSMYISVENIVENGQLAFQKFHRSQRRLIIARPKTGDVVMFVATLHPSATAGGNPDKNMESFRYLSGEDFVGLVFCSTLDGKYMEAWNYTGERIVPITVKTRREWLKHGDDLSNASYQAIQFSETIMTRTTYTGEEKKCEYHGTFSCECLDEAIVRTCSKCKSSLEPEKTCDCVLCIKCGKYIQPGIKCITCCCQDCGKFLLSGKNCDCKNICKDCEKQKPCPCDPNACPQCPSKSCSCRLCHSATCWGKCSSGGNTGGGYIPYPNQPHSQCPYAICNGSPCKCCPYCKGSCKCSLCHHYPCTCCSGERCPECNGIYPWSIPQTRSLSNCPVCTCWNKETHYNMLDSIIIDAGFPDYYLIYFREANDWCDSFFRGNQFSSQAYLHAMNADPDIPTKDAQKKFEEELIKRFQKILEGDLFSMGVAIHGMTDSFCPSHRGFQYVSILSPQIIEHMKWDKEENNRGAVQAAISCVIEVMKILRGEGDKIIRVQNALNYWKIAYNANLNKD